MNKYQEALDVMKKQSFESYEQYCDKYGVKPVSVLQELVDKVTPKKPKKIEEFISFNGIPYKTAECPNCKEYNKVRAYILENRCYSCGQKLDWSNSND